MKSSDQLSEHGLDKAMFLYTNYRRAIQHQDMELAGKTRLGHDVQSEYYERVRMLEVIVDALIDERIGS